MSDAGEKGVSVSRPEAREPDQRFPRRCRLTARRQFQTVYNEGRRSSCAAFTLFGMRNGLGHCRLGLTATRRTGKAVVRNRLKRIMREVFRRHRGRLEPPMDLVVNLRRSLSQRPARLVERDFLDCYAALARRTKR